MPTPHSILLRSRSSSRIFAASTLLFLAAASGCAVDSVEAPSSSDSDSDSTTSSSNSPLTKTGWTLPDLPPPKLDPNPPPPPPPIDHFAAAIAQFNGFDYDGDGLQEIEALSSMTMSSSNPPPTYAPKGMVVIFVDPRILAGSPAYSSLYVQIMLDLWGGDLRNEGFDPRFVRAQVRRDANQPDGTTVLSMRRFLRDLKGHFNLSGAIFVGDFPEPTIVRSVLIRDAIRNNPTMLGGTTVNNVDVLTLASETVALRSDLVLADLDGGWENVYRKELVHRDVTLYPTNVTTSDASWPNASQTYVGTAFRSTMRTYNDVFFVRDDSATVTDLPPRVDIPPRLQVTTAAGDLEPGPELNWTDRLLANPIARPEIHVTRINPRHVAKKPTNVLLESAVDANGVPRTLPAHGQPLRWNEDADTELRVLMDYIYRNRAFRNGSDNAQPFRTAVVRSPDPALANPNNYNAMLLPAHPGFAAMPSVINDGVNLIGYLSWLEQPAILRGIISHADATVSVFTGVGVGDPPNAEIIAKTGTPWFWHRDEATDTLYPSFERIGNGQIEIYRALWENKKLLGKGQRLYVHNGCEVNSPHNASSVNFTSPDYAVNQNGESQLFYTNGLAVLARAKVFFDSPRNVGDSIAQKGFFGAALHGYFDADAADGWLAPTPGLTGMDRRGRTLNRKKTYFWSVIGDYTLRVKY